MPEGEAKGGWLWLFAISMSALAAVLFGPRLYEEIKAWQTLVAGVVGFGGIAWVTYKTAELARQRDADLAAEVALAARTATADQVASLAMALGWELAHTTRELVTIRRRLMETVDPLAPAASRQQPTVVVHTVSNQLKNIPAPRIFTETIGKLVLPAIAVARLAGFYYEMAELLNLPETQMDDDDLHRVVDRLRLAIDSANTALSALRKICGPAEFPGEFKT